MSSERLALAAAAVVGIQVGACIASSRWLVHELGPVALTFLRDAIALASLLPFPADAPRAWSRLSARHALAAALLGITQFPFALTTPVRAEPVEAQRAGFDRLSPNGFYAVECEAAGPSTSSGRTGANDPSGAQSPSSFSCASCDFSR